MKPLKYSIFGGFELIKESVDEIKLRSNAIDKYKGYTPSHQKKKRGKLKRSGRK